MPKNSLKLKVGYLYPDILQSFCDDANVETFAQRAKWRNIEIEVNKICANDKIAASKYDFYYIGGNNPDVLNTALPYLRQNQDELRVASLSSVPMLAVNSGYQLFGNLYQLKNLPQQEGLGILNVDSVANKKFFRGNLVGTCSFLNNKTIVGYENHGIVTFLRKDTKPFLTVKKGCGNNGKDKTEGARVYNTIGTYISSPILAQNPHFCDFLLAVAIRVKYKCKIPITRLKDDIEMFSHNYMLEMK